MAGSADRTEDPTGSGAGSADRTGKAAGPADRTDPTGPAGGGYTFDTDTQVTPAGEPGRYRATVTNRWSILGGAPNGGYLLGICLRALNQELPDSHPDPLVVSAFFLRPGAVGEAELGTETVRVGRRIATGQASLYQGEKETVRVIADFTDLDAAQGRTQVRGEAPKLPAPDECVSLWGDRPLPELTVAERYDYRFPETPGWMRGAPTGEPHLEFWMRFTDDRPADPVTLPVLADAAPPAVMDIGEYLTSTVELTVYVRRRPVPGWLACRAFTRYLIDGYHEEDFEIWDSAGNLVAQGRQLAVLAPKN